MIDIKSKQFCEILDWEEVKYKNQNYITPAEFVDMVQKSGYEMVLRLSTVDREPNLKTDYYFVCNKKHKDKEGNIFEIACYAHNKIEKHRADNMFKVEEK